MDEVAMLRGNEPRKILRTAVEKKVPAVMSYSFEGKQRNKKVLLTCLGANRLDIRFSSDKKTSASHKTQKKRKQKPRPTDIRVNQLVNISLKYGYGQFNFDTTVIGIESASEDAQREKPTIVVAVPDRIEIVQKRNFFRVSVPDSLKVNVTMWHCYRDKKPQVQRTKTQIPDARKIPSEDYWQGKLVDISAGGLQVVIDTEQKPDFKKGQFLSLRFTPMPYEEPLMLNARIRNILDTADGKNMCMGLQIVGLKADPQGQQILHRLCSVAEHYYQINQYSSRQQDFQTTDLPR